MELFKIIKILFKALLLRKKKYTVHFIKQDSRWFADIPGWPDKYHNNAEMISGARHLLDTLDFNNTGSIYTEIHPNSYVESGNLFMTKIESALTTGAIYRVAYIKDGTIINFPEEVWICPVTLFVLGRYPKTMVIKTASLKIGT